MATHDLHEVEYAKLSEVKEGDILIADDDFKCMPPGPKFVLKDGDRLWIVCCEGGHDLVGQLDDDGDHLIGFYPQR